MAGRRPELAAPPQEFYGEEESKKYSHNSRIIQIQSELAERALELLDFDDDEPKLILDIGCGSGLSSNLLEENGHYWIGMDISIHMLNIARTRTVTGSMLLSDMGDGIPFRPSTFDAAISISALQWLCNADKTSHNPSKRLYKFFSTLYAALEQGAKAVFQFYPSDQHQIDLITTQARRAGFNGGLVIDFPESTKAKKYFLYLVAGGSANVEMPDGQTNSTSEPSTISNAGRGNTSGQRRGHRAPVKNSREWILNKKERRRRQGKDTRPDTRFTGRKRPDKF
jgi:18S rRNA (guanine1575-N7)-methyltransferase